MYLTGINSIVNHMKKLLFVSSIFAIFIFTQSMMIMKKDGAAPGYTGSPGDSFKNCTACHGGIAVEVDDWITSDIPAEGYVPGMTYTITATNKEAGATRFGFEISPQDTLGNLMGSMIITDAVRTKFVGGSKYITYTENGVVGVNSLSWSFKWVAPKSEEDVTFYGGFNSNFDGHKGGDQTFLSKLTVKRNKALSININKTLDRVKIYPNPTFDYVIVNFDVETAGKVNIDVVDVSGKVVLKLMEGASGIGNFNKQFDISNLANGNYLVRIDADGKQSTQKISINR